MLAVFRLSAAALFAVSIEAVAPKAGLDHIAANSAKDASRSTLRGRGTASINVTSVDVHHVLPETGHMKASVKGASQMPCQCIASDPTWVPCSRTAPACVFIDLGAADGNSFNYFLSNGYGNIAQCPSSTWSSVLVEANPRFNNQLALAGQQHPGQVNVMSATAAYMCEGTTSFFLDTVNTDKNFWGSSMSNNHPDVQRSGAQEKVTVPTMNLNRILFENTIPGDWVMVKMDIEGSEWDVIPCLAKAPAASLIDRLYLEQHDASWGMAGTTSVEMEAAKNVLRSRGVDMPQYFSHTL